MNFQLNVLGTASAKPSAGRNPSAQVLDVRGRLFLIDCGEGAQRQMCRMHLSFERLDAIFISHVHGDHIYGLFGLLSTIALSTARRNIRVYGPAALASVLDFFRQTNTDPTRLELEFIPVKCSAPTEIFSNKSVSVQAFPLKHRVETYGYIFREAMPKRNVHKFRIEQYGLGVEEICRLKEGADLVRYDSRGNEVLHIPNEELTYLPYSPRSFAYCSDTAPFPQLPEWVRGVDLLYHEATYGAGLEDEALERFHSTTIQAANCALQAGVGKLVCAHYSSRYTKTEPLLEELRSVFPNSFTADDGDVYDIPLQSHKS